MFSSLAGITSKYRVPILIVWVALAVVFFLFAPTLSEVGVGGETGSLPPNTESAQANRLIEENFAGGPADTTGGAIIVVYNPAQLSDADNARAKAVHDWLLSPQAPGVVSRVTSVFDQPELAPALVSKDKTTMVMEVQLSVDPVTQQADEAVREIRAQMSSQARDTKMYLSGEAGLSADLINSIQQTVDTTTLVTIILVIVLLLIIYRSPVAIFVPLITIGMSFLVARGVLGYMAAAGIQISALIDAYLVVTMFGVGTDYCLFLVSRFREELSGHDRKTAGDLALRRIGPVITASAVTVMVAFLCLGVSSFATTRTIGYALAIGVGITLLAGLTLTPALISLFGKNLFWPLKTAYVAAGNGRRLNWGIIGRKITARPLLAAVPILIILLVPYVRLPSLSVSADIFSQMPLETESVQGLQTVTRHFPSGEFSPFPVLIQSSSNLTDLNNLRAIETVAGSLSKVNGVSRIEYASAPGPLLDKWVSTVHGITNGLPGSITQLNNLSPLADDLRNLAISYPAVSQGPNQSANFKGTSDSLNNISTLGGQIQGAADVMRLLPDLTAALNSLEGNLTRLAQEFRLQTSTPFTAWLRSTYFSQDSTVARLNVIPNTSPYSKDNPEIAKNLRAALPAAIAAAGLPGAKTYVEGEGARQLDIVNTSNSDFNKVLVLASLAILIIVIFLLRSLLAPLYMVATVLLNFGTTLGVSSWLFLVVLKQNEITYLLPIFVFVILVAVGADYNIFLVSRIKEECQTKSTREAVASAVSRTGGIITACGVILAGTFAALTSAPLQLVFKIGGAIALGIIIDTFLVRAILVPSLVAIAGRWSWWPSRASRKEPAQPKSERAA